MLLIATQPWALALIFADNIRSAEAQNILVIVFIIVLGICNCLDNRIAKPGLKAQLKPVFYRVLG